jgi:hypothetical protein
MITYRKAENVPNNELVNERLSKPLTEKNEEFRFSMHDNEVKNMKKFLDSH